MTTPKERTFPDWKQIYVDRPIEGMPWFYEPLDPDVAGALDRLRVTSGRALDLGTGPGTQAIELARRGLETTGSDLAQAAVDKAKERAERAGVKVAFVADDVLASKLTGPFDVVLDRGCFHTLPPARRGDYARTVARIIPKGGHLFLKTFSAKQEGDFGPYRLSPDDIHATFDELFEVESITDTVYQGVMDPLPFALFCVLVPR